MQDAPSTAIPDVMTPAELAEYLRVPLSAIRSWRRVQAGPPAVFVRGKLRYLRPSVDAWLRDGADEAAVQAHG